MRRVAGIAVLVAGVLAFAVLGGGASNAEPGNEFKVELDNAFGLIEGGDFKIAGVRAGKISALDLDERTKRAIISFTVTEDGFGSLRTDARCEVAPQSLVGEYFVNCQPGTAKETLKPGSTIPVSRTSTTVPPDLVNNIMRLPYRQRLSLVINELGAAVAGNSDNLNDAIRRASPALRETNEVLAILARQNQVLADLVKNGDKVLGDLANSRKQVVRFVSSARKLSADSAERSKDIERGFQRLPTFLKELRPTMDELQATVDQQGPALRNVADSAGQLRRLFDNLPPFAKASRPAIRSLGDAADIGKSAVKNATPTVDELQRYSAGLPELSQNLKIVLNHLNDRQFSAEEDPRSPGGKGYTGLEALLQYVFDQTMSTNVHDGETHILKAIPFVGQCQDYADIKAAKELADKCSTALGPNQIGINFEDLTRPAGYDGADRGPKDKEPDPTPPADRGAPGSGEAGGPRPSAINNALPGNEGRGVNEPKNPVEDVVKDPPTLPNLDEVVPDVPVPQALDGKTPLAPKDEDRQGAAEQLANYLLGP